MERSLRARSASWAITNSGWCKTVIRPALLFRQFIHRQNDEVANFRR
uniref:Uncharacterized protein n=1 Tax=Romanomermis culicivorax TaxID=13658 RepID=A0A915JUZ2_ROMCU